MKPKPTAVERAERRVIKAAIVWYEWDHTIAESADDIATDKYEEMVEVIGDLISARRAARKKAGRK